MSKIQTIICLFVFLIVLFSMDGIFGNPLRESFRGGGCVGRGLGCVGRGLGCGGRGLGLGLGRQNISANGSCPNSGFLAVDVPKYYYNSDDQPLFFDFPFRFMRDN